MGFPKNLAILNANTRDAVYLPVSIDVIVCLVVPTAEASSSWDILRSFLNSLIIVLNRRHLSTG